MIAGMTPEELAQHSARAMWAEDRASQALGMQLTEVAPGRAVLTMTVRYRSATIDEFLLVQWLAPLASEAPELLVAGLYAWRLNTNAGLGTLVSSKVNQWTLLVGTLPIVFAIASGSLQGLPVEPRQREELLLTAAQSVFAVAILSTLSISIREAGWLLGLFFAQFIVGGLVPEEWHGVERIAVSVVYLVLAARIVVRDRRPMLALLRDGFRTPHDQLRTAE